MPNHNYRPHSNQSSKKGTQNNPNMRPNNQQNSATAPYNFIPLNDKVIPSDFEINKVPFNKYHNDKNTGYIDIEIETKTPIYIRDTDKLNNEQQINSDFFSPSERYRIPGSSIRGMIRTLVEIISFSKFGFCDDKKHLYYRAVADKSSINPEYKKKMIDENDHLFPKFKAGFLFKQDNRYYICPSVKDRWQNQIYRVDFRRCNRLNIGDFDFIKIKFTQIEPNLHTHNRWDRQQNRNVPYDLKYALINNIC